MTPFTARDKLLIMLGYTARLALYKASHNGYTPDEWQRIQEADAGLLRDVRGLAYESTTGEKP